MFAGTKTSFDAASPLPSDQPTNYSAVVVQRPDELKLYLPAWEELAREAVEINVFYESWMLAPAVRLLSEGEEIIFVLIFAAETSGESGRPRLCGIFPLQFRRYYREVPARTLTLWRHKYCFLCTPLLHKRDAKAALAAFLDWLAANPFKASLMEFHDIPVDGTFHRLLVDELARRWQSEYVMDSFSRAILAHRGDGEAYLRESLSKKRRKELNRLGRRLADTGRIECLELDGDGDVESWCRRFLALESDGWKGRDGGAMNLEAASREFFLATAREAFRRSRLMMLGLFLDGRPIAMKCNFLAAPGSFAFKIAYDETLGRFSPGLQLEIANIHRFHLRPELQWMDSCTVQDHFMMNHLWRDRRTFQTVTVATGCGPGDLVVSILPMRQWLRRKLNGSVFRSPV